MSCVGTPGPPPPVTFPELLTTIVTDEKRELSAVSLVIESFSVPAPTWRYVIAPGLTDWMSGSTPAIGMPRSVSIRRDSNGSIITRAADSAAIDTFPRARPCREA
jgi:hypothetical protein